MLRHTLPARRGLRAGTPGSNASRGQENSGRCRRRIRQGARQRRTRLRKIQRGRTQIEADGHALGLHKPAVDARNQRSQPSDPTRPLIAPPRRKRQPGNTPYKVLFNAKYAGDGGPLRDLHLHMSITNSTEMGSFYWSAVLAVEAVDAVKVQLYAQTTREGWKTAH
jgi:hypothetical protein